MRTGETFLISLGRVQEQLHFFFCWGKVLAFWTLAVGGEKSYSMIPIHESFLMSYWGNMETCSRSAHTLWNQAQLQGACSFFNSCTQTWQDRRWVASESGYGPWLSTHTCASSPSDHTCVFTLLVIYRLCLQGLDWDFHIHRTFKGLDEEWRELSRGRWN